jgi:hypothetical protein
MDAQQANVEPVPYDEAKAFAEEHRFDYLGPANGSIVERRPAPCPLPSVRQGQRGTPWRYLFRLHLQAVNDIVPGLARSKQI